MKNNKNLHHRQNEAPLLAKEGCPDLSGRGGRMSCSNIHSLQHLKTFRTALRSNLTPAEAFLWKELQNSKLDGRKFRRQHSIGNYIVDFYCPSEQIAIELDGEVHYNEVSEQYDTERDLFINQFNVRVLRFENKQVFDNLEGVLEEIRKYF